MSLIPRFYDPSAGEVLVDGIDVRDYRLQTLRDQIGYVLQETVLFRGTVRDNIAYGREGATDEEIVEAAKLANADEFISRMPNGYRNHSSATGATPFPAASASASESRARSYATTLSLFSTNRRPPWTPNRKGWSSKRWNG